MIKITKETKNKIDSLEQRCNVTLKSVGVNADPVARLCEGNHLKSHDDLYNFANQYGLVSKKSSNGYYWYSYEVE